MSATDVFTKLGVSKGQAKRLVKIGFEVPSPIQSELIPKAIDGDDCIGLARTGTGKTAAFMIPIWELIEIGKSSPQALVMCPTRELSEQVAEEGRKLCPHKKAHVVTAVGGRPINGQIRDLQHAADVVVGTPGRVIDLMQRGDLNLSDLHLCVLDEADRMLDIGFRPDIEKILRRCPDDHQTLLLSATMPEQVERLADRFMESPVRIDLSQDISSENTIDQFFCTVEQHEKLPTLIQILLAERPRQAIVFCRTKRGADKLYASFHRRLPGAAVLHGDLAQSRRDRVMKSFRSGKTRLLIATDVVGRGIDISGVSHIINYDIPQDCDDYVHRIGRTGRLSSDDGTGRAITLVTAAEGSELTRVEMKINQLIEAYPLS